MQTPIEFSETLARKVAIDIWDFAESPDDAVGIILSHIPLESFVRLAQVVKSNHNCVNSAAISMGRPMVPCEICTALTSISQHQ